MSLVCETIVSEDELSRASDEELDFEPNDSNQTPNAVDVTDVQPNDEDSRDEGELDDDDDLEEGEVKEDDVTPVVAVDANRRAPPNARIAANDDPRAHSVCRFFGRGQCTWGNACRFMHTTRDGMTCATPKRAPPLPPPPPPPPMPPPPAMSRPRGGGREESESAWERGLKQAKEMIVRASRRKEQEIDFEDKRFNLGVADDADSSPERLSRPLQTDAEYERRRRLAFESAPWNTSDTKTRAAETYRDPWRRSKSPPKAARRPLTAGSKRSHSMSSISASATDSSDFSGSDSASEFSESSAASSAANRQRFSRRTAERPKDSEDARPKKVANPSATATVAAKNSAEPTAAYDSWSESLSDSDSISSYYSASNSDSDASRDSNSEPKGRPKKSAEHRPLKKNKVSDTPLSPLLPNKKAGGEQLDRAEAPKKSPIKMTFLKKHSKIKKDNLMAAKLNGGRDKAEAEAMEATVAADEEDADGGGRDALSSPVSTEALSPPESDVGSKAIDKQSLSATVSRREELLQQLRAVEDAIARKRSKIN